MMRLNRIFSALLIMVLFSFSIFIIVWQHEAVHKEIYSYYGINSSIHYSLSFKESILEGNIAYTQIDDINQAKLCDKDCKKYQIMNEIIGYNLVAIVNFIWLIVLAIFVFIILRGSEKDA